MGARSIMGLFRGGGGACSCFQLLAPPPPNNPTPTIAHAYSRLRFPPFMKVSYRVAASAMLLGLGYNQCCSCFFSYILQILSRSVIYNAFLKIVWLFQLFMSPVTVYVTYQGIFLPTWHMQHLSAPAHLLSYIEMWSSPDLQDGRHLWEKQPSRSQPLPQSAWGKKKKKKKTEMA